MNWKLIFQLSLFGLAMAFATIWLIPSSIEFIFWMVIFAFCAFVIARRAPGSYFLHGFLTSMVNAVWITGAHIIFSDDYLVSHPEELNMMIQMGFSEPRLMMAIVGPFAGAIFGLILGVFSWAASRFSKKTSTISNS